MNVERWWKNGVLVREMRDGKEYADNLGKKHDGFRRLTFSVTPEPWPLILLPLRAFAKTDDRGAGDIIARVIGPIGGDAFKIWYKKMFGKNCGCGNRQAALNARWPL